MSSEVQVFDEDPNLTRRTPHGSRTPVAIIRRGGRRLEISALSSSIDLGQSLEIVSTFPEGHAVIRFHTAGELLALEEAIRRVRGD